MDGRRSVDGDGFRPNRSAKRRTRRELLRLAGRTPNSDDSGQRRDDEFAARLVALVNAGVLSRRELLQLSAAGGFLAFLEQHGGLVRLIEATGPPVRQLPAAVEAGPDGEIDIDRGEALPQQQRADPIIAPTFTASAFRREDMLTLDFEFFNLVLVGTKPGQVAAIGLGLHRGEVRRRGTTRSPSTWPRNPFWNRAECSRRPAPSRPAEQGRRA